MHTIAVKSDRVYQYPGNDYSHATRCDLGCKVDFLLPKPDVRTFYSSQLLKKTTTTTTTKNTIINTKKNLATIAVSLS